MPKVKSKSRRGSPLEQDFSNEASTLQIMKEMNLEPLSITPSVDENIINYSTRKKPLQQANGQQYGFYSPPKMFTSSYMLYKKFDYTQDEEDYFAKLSDEIILHIFDWLPKHILVKCSQVCKRWKRLSYDESFWKRYDFGRRVVKSGAIGILISRGVTALRLAMSDIRSPVFVDAEFTNYDRFSRLKYLDFSMATISENDLSEVLSMCNMLKKLSLEYCTVNEKSLKSIAQNKNLEVLNLAMCEGLTGDGLHAIGTNCKRLQELNLSWCHLDELCMKKFLPVLPHSIRRLNISGHRSAFDDEDLITIIRRCPFLLELDISDSPNITEDSFTILVENCSLLVHLHISGCYNLPSSCNMLLKTMRDLKYIEFFRTLTDESLVAFRESLPDMKINQTIFSTIARPTTGIRRTSIWGLRVRD